MEQKFDLTTENGLRNALKYAGDALLYLNPMLAIGKYLVDKTFSRNTESLEKQKKTAEDLIIAGKKNGVDEMEIIMDNQTGTHLNFPVDECKVDFMLGADDKTHVHVKYK